MSLAGSLPYGWSASVNMKMSVACQFPHITLNGHCCTKVATLSAVFEQHATVHLALAACLVSDCKGMHFTFLTNLIGSWQVHGPHLRMLDHMNCSFMHSRCHE